MRYHDPYRNGPIISMDKNGDRYCVDVFFGGLPNNFWWGSVCAQARLGRVQGGNDLTNGRIWRE